MSLFAVSLFNAKPPLMAVTKPSANVILMIFAPKMLPKESVGLADSADSMPTNNSGSEVANDIKINAKVNSPIPKKRDIRKSVLTSNEPLLTRIKNDMSKMRK